MKKTILLLAFLVSAITFTSCSNDDSSPTQDPIIGKWKITKVLENNIEQDLSCDEKEGVIEYKSDGTYSYQEYSISNTTGDCVFTETFEGNTWKNNNDGTYEFIEDGDKFVDKIVFSNDTFIATYQEDNDTYNVHFKRQ